MGLPTLYVQNRLKMLTTTIIYHPSSHPHYNQWRTDRDPNEDPKVILLGGWLRANTPHSNREPYKAE